MIDQPSRPSAAELLARVDAGWARLRERIDAFPVERLDEPIGEGWTRKQMLAHLAAWHESASTRLAEYVRTGERQPLSEDDDAFNARVARSAVGRTAGEVLHALAASFARLRRQIRQLSDDQLTALDGWPAGMLASNTYEHYADHLGDLDGR